VNKASLGYLDALSEFREALARFRSIGLSLLGANVAEISGGMRVLDYRLKEARAHVRECEYGYAQADEESATDAQRALAGALASLATISRWHGRAEASCQAFRAEQAAMEAALTEQILRCQAQLELKRRQAGEYLAVSLVDTHASGGLGSSGDAARQTRAREPDREAWTLDSITGCQLPPGFVWVDLSQINRRDDLREDERFAKVSESDVRRGFGTLLRKVLPYLNKEPTVTSDTIGMLDGQSEKGTPRSMQTVFDAFFGSEPIVLDRNYADGTFSVTNGRHRIKVARDLGWPAVPAKIMGTDRGPSGALGRTA
jgi:hypothetical protein